MLEAVDLLIRPVEFRAASVQFQTQMLVFSSKELRLLLPSFILFQLPAIHGERNLPKFQAEK